MSPLVPPPPPLAHAHERVSPAHGSSCARGVVERDGPAVVRWVLRASARTHVSTAPPPTCAEITAAWARLAPTPHAEVAARAMTSMLASMAEHAPDGAGDDVARALCRVAFSAVSAAAALAALRALQGAVCGGDLKRFLAHVRPFLTATAPAAPRRLLAVHFAVASCRSRPKLLGVLMRDDGVRAVVCEALQHEDADARGAVVHVCAALCAHDAFTWLPRMLPLLLVALHGETAGIRTMLLCVLWDVLERCVVRRTAHGECVQTLLSVLCAHMYDTLPMQVVSVHAAARLAAHARTPTTVREELIFELATRAAAPHTHATVRTAAEAAVQAAARAHMEEVANACVIAALETYPRGPCTAARLLLAQLPSDDVRDAVLHAMADNVSAQTGDAVDVHACRAFVFGRTAQ